MIEPWMILLWIGSLSFVIIVCTIVDMFTESKEERYTVTRKIQETIEPEHEVSSFISNEYDDVMILDEE